MKCLCVPGAGKPCKSCGCCNHPNGPGHRANGDLCENPVVPTTHRCHMHGGSTPVAKLKAEMALALLRMPAVEALHEALETQLTIIRQYNAVTCPTCGLPLGDEDEKNSVIRACAVILKNAQVIMDRAGLPPRALVEIKQSDGDLDLRALTPDEQARMMSLLAELRSIKDDVRKRINGLVTGNVPEPPTVQ